MRSHLVDPAALWRFRGLYEHLASGYSHSVLLDSCGWDGPTGGRYVMGLGAKRWIRLADGFWWVNEHRKHAVPDAATLQSSLIAWHVIPPAGSPTDAEPFEDAWFGTLGYGLNRLLEPAVQGQAATGPMGDLYWIQCEHTIVWEPAQGDFRVLSADSAWAREARRLWETEMPFPRSDFQPTAAPIAASMDRDGFEARVEQLLSHIRRGDLYQANLSIRFEMPDFPEHQGFALYAALVGRNPSPFSGIFKTPEGTVLSNSPERLVKLDARTGRVETRPIAGTRGRGSDPQSDQRIGADLQSNLKEQAEHRMLLDLARNDLGRVSLPGSVRVTEEAVLERYSHVTHLVSQVEGVKPPDKTAWDVLAAMFPGGTITGCPKIRCMTLLGDLEPVARGLYTGSLGYVDASGHLDFNILIRSLFHGADGRLQFHAGAGIVADSVPSWEYRECLRKAQAIQGVLHHDVSRPRHHV